MLLDKRIVYKPFEYETAFKFWETQQQAHWLPKEVAMSNDLSDWHTKIKDSDKYLIGNILKGFTQSEIFIEDYWSNKVANWFKKPEIQMMANCFANVETIHAVAYAYLNDTLGFDDYSGFLSHESTKAKIDRLIDNKPKTLEDKALSLAVFSAFNEGVNLFSSFMVLLNYSRFNMLKGVGQIITWSVRDESLHSNAGCWLFNTLVKEYPEIVTLDFTEKIYESARLTEKLEFDFIDSCFEQGNPKGLDKAYLKGFIKYRLNLKLKQIGFKSIYKVSHDILNKLDWFDILVSGVEHSDFFSTPVTDYSKGNLDWSTAFPVKLSEKD